MAALQRAMGFDYGTRQIGVAVGQSLTCRAEPIAVLRARDGVPDWTQIERLIAEWKPDTLVVGLPLNMDGTPSEMSGRAEKFGRRLHGRRRRRVFWVQRRRADVGSVDPVHYFCAGRAAVECRGQHGRKDDIGRRQLEGSGDIEDGEPVARPLGQNE